MRLAFVTETYPPEVNGVALTVQRAVEHLRALEHNVDLIRPRQADESPGGSTADEWRSSGYAIPMYPDLRFGVARTRALAARFRLMRPQLVHVATQGPLGWAAVSAARHLGIPTTSDFRTNFHLYSRHYRLGWMAGAITAYLRRFHNRTGRSFAPTQRTREALVADGFERVEVVGRGVDLQRFSPVHRDFALHTRWSPAGGPVLLYVGRLAAEKNVALALRAFRRARAFVPTVQMIVVGDGPLRHSLEREYPEARFVGLRTGAALATIYASADLFLFPSLTDTFGNVTLEALASGLPVIAFDTAAAADFVVDRISGRLVTPGDEEGFAIATCLFTSLYPELAPMRRDARRAALRAEWGTVLDRFERLLLETADAHRPAGSRTACLA